MHLLQQFRLGYSESSSWPYVTLPNFDIRATEAEELTGIGLIVYAPLVTTESLQAWEAYSVANQGWIQDDWNYRDASVDVGNISPTVYYQNASSIPATVERHLPVWQTGPVPLDASVVNMDLYQQPVFERLALDVMDVKHTMISDVVNMDFLLERILQNYTHDGEPRSVVFEPVADDFHADSNVMSLILAELAWSVLLKDVLPTGVNGILIEVQGSCGSAFTYEIHGHQAKYLGTGYLHDPKYERLIKTFPFAESARYDGDDTSRSHCEFTLRIVATPTFESAYYTNGPAVFASVVVLTFFITACVFALYDWMVFRRQTKLKNTAERTQAIVASLFPKDVRDRMMAEADEKARAQEQGNTSKGLRESAKTQLKGFLDDSPDGLADTIFKTKPIADLFPEVTVLFADLVGFTAWSSMREPAQVFMLLETIYHEFDQIAKRRRVFKVETVGDCYVAVTGLPESRKDHATVMARFSRNCMYKMHSLLRQLEVTLGPDTAELGLRFGLHSGPVTAGVLRCERSRFQLFGDTMNTTARIESTGAKNKIHLSQETAELLVKAGKGHWVRAREEKVFAKGKGELATYWLEIKGGSSQSHTSTTSSESGNEEQDLDGVKVSDKMKYAVKEPVLGDRDCNGNETFCRDDVMSDKDMRLVNWNTEIIGKLLKEIIARREATGAQPDPQEQMTELERKVLQNDRIVLEECADVIELPSFCSALKKQRDPDSVKLEPAVVNQLREFIQIIAAMYRDNPFHNFAHASHVTMSVIKLLSRIVAPDIQVSGRDYNECDKELHDHTYGITSSPLTRFAIVISALIHDVDHTGVPNSQLIKEQASIASVYKNKSVAEQNSIDIAWDLLMQDSFTDLRRTIYQTEAEFKRFRQLLVNAVLATDIMDKELNLKRKERWTNAFSESCSSESSDEMTARKATIVIEHLIQASDVVHTMQHWHIYRKWNERLFLELYKAYKEGRSTADPSATWYEGEIGFFDFYIIPLAMKLKDCGVFGVSSDECLNYAKQNRREWEAKGQEVVVEMKEKAEAQYANRLYL